MARVKATSPPEVASFWSKLPPPIRPSQLVLKIFDKHLEHAREDGEGRVLVLGATPELRSLALRRGFEVTYVDKSRLMIDAMNRLMDYTDIDKTRETCTMCDWLETPSVPKGYQAILGDNSLNELSLQRMKKLLRRLRTLLDDTGSLCLRMTTFPEATAQPSISDVIAKYRDRSPKDGMVDMRSILAEACFAKNVYEASERSFSFERLRTELREAYASGDIQKREFEIFSPILKMEYASNVPFRSEFREMIHPYFQTDHIHSLEKTEDKEFGHVYVMSPR